MNQALILAKFKYSNVLYNAEFISQFSVDNAETPSKTFIQVSNSQILTLPLYQHAEYTKNDLVKRTFVTLLVADGEYLESNKLKMTNTKRHNITKNTRLSM